MLKVGDKLLCKKSIDFHIDFHNYNIHFDSIIIKGKYYTITFINNITYFYINKIYFDNDKFYCSTNRISLWYIWDFFYKPQEVRKMKLKQLKQCLK